jgi:serine/threonine protein kinase
MAPEQARGAPEDERTDVFALGVLLFQMLEHALPPKREVTGADLSSMPQAVPLLRRLLAPDPVDRPRDGASALEALSALARVVERGTAPAAPVAEAPGPRPRNRRLRCCRSRTSAPVRIWTTSRTASPRRS